MLTRSKKISLTQQVNIYHIYTRIWKWMW